MIYTFIATHKLNSGVIIDRSDLVCIKCLTFYLGCIIGSFIITLLSKKWVRSYSYICPTPYVPFAASNIAHQDFVWVPGGLTKNRRMAARAEPVEELKTEDVECLSQAVSPNDEPCDFPATVHCAKLAGSAMPLGWRRFMKPASDTADSSRGRLGRDLQYLLHALRAQNAPEKSEQVKPDRHQV